MIDKQLMKLKVAEEYTNDMLGRALSKAEFYSSRYGKKSLDIIIGLTMVLIKKKKI